MSKQLKLNTLQGLPSKDGEPVFESPWQAQTFAMVIQLHESGVFTWNEWADELSANIADFETGQPIDGSDDYYTLWHHSLEQILKRKQLITL